MHRNCVFFKLFLPELQHFFPPLISSCYRRKQVPIFATYAVFAFFAGSNDVLSRAIIKAINHGITGSSQFSILIKTGYVALHSAKQHTRFKHYSAQAEAAYT